MSKVLHGNGEIGEELLAIGYSFLVIDFDSHSSLGNGEIGEELLAIGYSFLVIDFDSHSSLFTPHSPLPTPHSSLLTQTPHTLHH